MIGIVGIFNFWYELGKYWFEINELKWKLICVVKEYVKVYEMLKDFLLDWIIICFIYFLDGIVIGIYCIECDVLLEGGMSIMVGDIVDFLYCEFVIGEYVGYCVGLVY